MTSRRAGGFVVLWLLLGCDHPDAAPAPPGEALPLACRARLEPDELLPADAWLVARYDMERERRHAPSVERGQSSGPRAIAPSAAAEALRLAWIGMAAACELDEDYFGVATVAVDTEEEIVGVLTGTGVGDPATLRCIQHRLGRYADELLDEGVLEPDGCGMRVRFGELHGFAPHDDLLVLGTPDGIARSRAAWNAGHGTGPRRLMPGRGHAKSYVWAAVDVAAVLSPDEIEAACREADMDPEPFLGLRTAWLDAQLGRRYELSVGATFAAEADARAAEAVVQALIDAPPPWLPPWSLTLLEKLELLRDGTSTEVALELRRRKAHELGLLPSRTEAEQAPSLPWLVLALFD